MTHFDEAYAKILMSPDYGKLNKRREQAKQMYIEGMKKSMDLCGEEVLAFDCIIKIQQQISDAEESK